MEARWGTLSGFEALLRLDDPNRGPISPAELIPVAEASGLIVPIGGWVLREACRQLREWLDEGLPATKMSVNVSVLEITGDSFADGVAIVLDEERVDPGCWSPSPRSPAVASRTSGLVLGDFVFLEFGLADEEHVNLISVDTVDQTFTAIVTMDHPQVRMGKFG